MAIKPVSGEIKAQPLNDNFSYLDSQISSVSIGPFDTYTSLSALQSAYPNGRNGFAVVLEADGKTGYMYTWNGTTWKKGGLAQAMGIADTSVNGQKLGLPYDLLPITPVFVIGEPNPANNGEIINTSNRIITRDILKIKNGTIHFGEGNIQAYIARYDDSGNFLGSAGWQTTPIKVENKNIRVIIKKNDNTSFGGSVNLANQNVYISTDATAISNDEAKKTFLKSDDYDVLKADFIKGQHINTGPTTPSTRCRTVEMFYLPQGTTVSVTASDTVFNWLKYTENETFLRSSGWLKSINLDEGYYRFNQKYEDDRVFDDYEFFKENFTIDRHNKIVTENMLGDLSNPTKYVSLSGNDDSSGDSPTSAYATFQKAIDSGAKTIFAERGKYFNQSVVSNSFTELVIKPYKKDTFDAISRPDVQKIEIINGDFKTGEKLENLYKIPFSGNSRFRQVFVDKTLPLETTSSRPSYNVGVWQNHITKQLDQTLKPVLTISEVEETPGTFTWSNNEITINPLINDSGVSPVGFTIHNDAMASINLQNGQKLTMIDVVASYSYSQNMTLRNIQEIYMQNCEAHYTMLSDNISLDYSNGNLYRCISTHARNDGFNMHYFGDTHLWGCEGHYNGDDGVSHHDGCTGSINNGKWSYNGKGGISSPTYGSQVNLYSNYCHANKFGLYVGGIGDYAGREIMAFGNVFKNNRTGDIDITGDYTMLGKDNIFDTINDSSKYIDLGV